MTLKGSVHIKIPVVKKLEFTTKQILEFMLDNSEAIIVNQSFETILNTFQEKYSDLNFLIGEDET